MQSDPTLEHNTQKLLELFPHCATEIHDSQGNITKGIDFDLLRQTLSASVIEGKERYQLDWVGKKKALSLINQPITKTLRPQRDESIDFDSTQNLFIEGDNLDALKLLQKSHLGKVKMIYIDPPYNTGNDFIYRDKFSETKHDYEQRSGDTDEDGNRLIHNTHSNGRFHSDWLSMMYSRLILARHLLRDDGVIFISIDDSEQANLKHLCDQVFGEHNFIDIFSWQKTTTPSNLSKKTKKTCEYILAYQKESDVSLLGVAKNSKSSNGLMNQSNTVSNLIFPPFYTKTKLSDGVYQAGMYGTDSYDIELLENTEVKGGEFIKPIHLRGKFKWSQQYLDQQIQDNVSIFIQTAAFSPSYKKAEYQLEKVWNLINEECGVGTNENASKELDNLFYTNFSDKLYPKPTSLLRYLINTNVAKQNDIILDFFAGSGTTAHAVMQLNAEDGGNRRFIMVQLPEEIKPDSEAYKAGFRTIADITKERIRRAGAQLRDSSASVKPSINENGLFNDGVFSSPPPPPQNQDLDVGFRVLKIDSSNMEDVYYRPDELSQNDLFVENIKPDRSSEDLLFQVMIDYGVSVSLPIAQKRIVNAPVYCVDKNFLVACFEGLSMAVVDEIAKLRPTHFVSRDGAVKHDHDKANIRQRFKVLSPETRVVFL